jgi:cell division protein FtsZ
MSHSKKHDNTDAAAKPTSVKIIGVGTAGLNLVEQLVKGGLPGAAFVAVNADANSVASSSAPEKISLNNKTLRGLGTGGDPERGRVAAEENAGKLKAACDGADVVFILTGLGGGAGSGISPVLARVAKESGALVLAFATLPFDCEGNRRQRQAHAALEQLKAAADGVICLPNQKTFKLIDENTSVVDTFKLANELLAEAVGGVWRLMARRGLIEIHFEELSALLRDRHGESSFATAEATGPSRSAEVMEKLFAHPLLDGGTLLSEADAVLVSVTGGPDLSMSAVHRVMEQINGKCERAQVIMGAAIDDAFKERLAITLVAVRRAEPLAAPAGVDEAAHHAEAARGVPEELDSQPLDRTPQRRTRSRFTPPPPAMTPEKMQEIINGPLVQQPSRTRRNASKMRQGQLPLEIVSKGRFDKSEPTIHKGEDLDVPTYIRRGVALN